MHFASRSIFFYLRNYFHCLTKVISEPYSLAFVQQYNSLYSERKVSAIIAFKILRQERSIMDTSWVFKMCTLNAIGRAESLTVTQRCVSCCGRASDSQVTLIDFFYPCCNLTKSLFIRVVSCMHVHVCRDTHKQCKKKPQTPKRIRRVKDHLTKSYSFWSLVSILLFYYYLTR